MLKIIVVEPLCCYFSFIVWRYTINSNLNILYQRRSIEEENGVKSVDIQ